MSGSNPASREAPPRRRWRERRGVAWLAGGVLAIAVAAIVATAEFRPPLAPSATTPAPGATTPREAPRAAPPATATGPAAPGGSAAAAVEKPSFDVVRVAPDGAAVIAGRAAPGADVTVHDGTETLGRARADDRGEWVLTPDRKLAPGARELTLSEQLPATADKPPGQVVPGDAPVVLALPDRQASASVTPALAVLTPEQGAPRVLQGPTDKTKPGGHLGMDVVDYDQHGDIRFSGGAPPGAPVRVYVDNHPAGDARADAAGRWTLVPATGESGYGHAIAPGLHQLRVDQLNAQGRVVGRVELPFQRVELAAAEVGPGHIVVQPGQNLWRIARATYGRGIHYVVIYRANLDQIRDPARIYPGQTFALPSTAGADGATGIVPTPSSSSRSR